MELVAAGTVNTMPEQTLAAVYDHGTIRGDTITGTYDDARAVLDGLRDAGVDYDDVVTVLEEEGVAKFEDSWNALIESVVEQMEKAGATVKEGGSVSPAGDGPAAASTTSSA